MVWTNTIYSVEAIRALEQAAYAQAGTEPGALMARAGRGAYECLMQRWPDCKHIALLCGAGNNGGDGYVVAELAAQQGLRVTVQALKPIGELCEPALSAAHRAQAAGADIQAFNNTLVAADVYVDAIFGIGLCREVSGQYQQAIARLNEVDAPILAIDTPSGLNADTGVMLPDAVRATTTITFIGLKTGLVQYLASHCVGDIVVDNLDLSEQLFASVQPSLLPIELEPLREQFLPRRPRDTHKGQCGHVLVIGGDHGTAGAALMASRAALRVGAGLVSIATRAEHSNGFLAVQPELMCHGIAEPCDLTTLLARASVIVLGPGLGQGDWSQMLFKAAVQSNLPMVVDADALNILAQHSLQSPHWILTPHPGEAARLLGDSTAAVQADRIKAAQHLTERYDGVAVLKGHGSLIAKGDAITEICPYGNPGMASAGMGDMLSGVIGGLLAQGLSLSCAATLGVALHAKAADLAAAQGERGLVATDLLEPLRTLVNPL